MGNTNLFRTLADDKPVGSTAVRAGQNIEARITGSMLTIVIDLSHDLGLSKSGKSTLIASTNGNVVLPGGARLGLNVFRACGHDAR
jgi:hypothetical protein